MRGNVEHIQPPGDEAERCSTSRRDVLQWTSAAALWACFQAPALAVQGLTAGRIPGEANATAWHGKGYPLDALKQQSDPACTLLQG